MLKTKHARTVGILITAIIIGAAVSSIVIVYNWQSIYPPSKYPIALGSILFSMPNSNSSELLQIQSVSIGIRSGNASAPTVIDWITLNTTGLQPIASPLVVQQGGKFATSDYITLTKYSVGQTVVINRMSNITQIDQQLVITVTSKMLQYTVGEYVNMQATHTGYAIAIPTNVTWNAIPD